MNGLEAIQRLDRETGFIAVAYGLGTRLLKTNDGGKSWTRVPIPATAITALRFIDQNTGWVAVTQPIGNTDCSETGTVGPVCRAALLRTTDGGRSWQPTLTAASTESSRVEIRQVQAIDGDRAWAVVPTAGGTCTPGCEGELVLTSDGGLTWKPLLRAKIAALRFATYYRGWIVTTAERSVAVVETTSDGGSTWGSPFTTHGSDLISLDAASPLVAWYLTGSLMGCTASTCSNYDLYRTANGGGSWQRLGNPRATGCGAGHLGNPLFASPTRGWVTLNTGAGGAGLPGGLIATDDGGRSWHCVNPPANTGPLSAADPLDVWVAARRTPGGWQSDLYSSDDGGTTWTRLDYVSSVA